MVRLASVGIVVVIVVGFAFALAFALALALAAFSVLAEAFFAFALLTFALSLESFARWTGVSMVHRALSSSMILGATDKTSIIIGALVVLDGRCFFSFISCGHIVVFRAVPFGSCALCIIP